jgi:hypothetical protein
MTDKKSLDDLCPECGAKVHCARLAGKNNCWCDELPHVMPMKDPGTACLCKTCLDKKIAKHQPPA